MKRNSQQGIALVITLILLTVITFMAVTFLVVSRSERTAVTVHADQIASKHAADTALERAKDAMIVPIMAFSNAQAFQLRVSTNFSNPEGFDPTLPANGNRFTNVNYDFADVNKKNPKPLTRAQMEQNIANLLYDPRPPVFIRTNGARAGVSDFRYYLDLNRNGRFDPNGFLPVTNNLGQQVLNAQGDPVTNYFVGDPEWVGVLERPDFPHSATNKFMARWAYIVLPAGAALDLNYIHNQAKGRTLDPFGRNFLRNEGVGSWEINLGGFLYDLNTNIYAWGGRYVYDPLNTGTVDGNAFVNAGSLLSYRYQSNYNNLGLGFAGLAGNGIDDYSDGLLTSGTVLPPENDPNGAPWLGSDNPNHYFTTQDFFDPNKVSPDFVARLNNASKGRSSYDQYTYYRLLSQLTTDSALEPSSKMNLNHDNLVQRNAGGVASATNFFPWQPIDFFTNAANRMLQTSADMTVTNIPIYPTNYYTPAVHRLLQLAANMYDATTNRALTAYPYLPSVFRPIFRSAGSNIFIAGYVEEINARITNSPCLDLRNSASFALIRPVGTPIDPNDPTEPMVYGVPLVIGAKKGFPNFNEYSMQTIAQVTRRLEFHRRNTFSAPFQTNQMYSVGISNVFAVEAWNSYTNPFPRALDLYVTNELSIVMTNKNGVIRATNMTMRQTLLPGIPANTWQGLVTPVNPQQSFRIPLLTNVVFLTNSTYSERLQRFVPLTGQFETGVGFPVPQWGLNITNRLRYILVDRATQRVVDYVNLAGLDSYLDITRELSGNASEDPRFSGSVQSKQWLTNRVNNSVSDFAATYGIINQIEVSLGNQQVSQADWDNFNFQTVDKAKAIDGFRAFFRLSSTSVNSNLVQQAPFTPARKIYQNTSWQANDPLVHYTLRDLTDLARTNDINFITPPNQQAPFMPNLSKINTRYQPWGGNPNKTTSADPNAFNLALKDPLVNRSDDWEFPTNKLPNVAWLGRVHRGTPWQTVYLKSTPIADQAQWQKWTGNELQLDAALSIPTNDRYLLDLFTVAPNDNASRGQMSINNPDIAGWSAILSGVIALTNSATDAELNTTKPLVKFDPWVIEPAGANGTNSQLFRIVEALNRDRTNVAFHPDQTFHNLGDILATPELTVASPFLNLTNDLQKTRGLTDPVYERIPQQILSLLKVGEPRFVIYSYGQSLKPADRSIIQNAPFTGMSTNYQITGETVTRTVVRIEGAPNNPRTVVESFNVLPPD